MSVVDIVVKTLAELIHDKKVKGEPLILTYNEVCEHVLDKITIHPSRVAQILSRLVSEGYLIRISKGVYIVKPKFAKMLKVSR